jgi:hypothetical protein
MAAWMRLRRGRIGFVILTFKGKPGLFMRFFIAIVLVSSQWVAPGPLERDVRAQSSGPISNGSGMRIYLPIVMRESGAVLSAVPQPGPYAIGQVLRVDIVVQTDRQVRSARVALSFNPAVLRCDEVREGPFFSTWAAANNASTAIQPIGQIDNGNGLVSDTAVTLIGGPSDSVYAQGPTGTGIVISYLFTVISSGISYINLTNTMLVDNQIQNPQNVEVSIRNTQVDVNILVSSIGQTHIDAKVESHLGLAVDNSIDLSTLSTGFNTFDGSLTVQSNGDYQVDVAGITTPSESNKDLNQVETPASAGLFVQAEGFRGVQGTGGVLLNGSASGQGSGDAGQSFSLTYIQVWRPELDAGLYRVILTYHSYVKV